MKVVLGSTEDVWTEVLPASRAPQLRPAQAGAVHRGRASRPAGSPAPRSGRSTARSTRGCTWICPSSPSSTGASAPRATSRRRTWSAHEVGHHVQNLLGISERVHASAAGCRRAEGNRLSVATELQADCLAGVWAFHANRARPAARARRRRGGADGGRRDRRRHAAESRARAGSSPSRSRTARPRSACAGSRRGMSAGRVADCDTFGAGAPLTPQR